MTDPNEASYWQSRRERMVDEQIRARGIADPRVIDAMRSVPREQFVPPDLRASACDDRALPIGHGQTISQPFIVAYMTEQLAVSTDALMLEIGTGSGYQTAILATLARHVYSVERMAALHDLAAANLARLGIHNVTLTVADGTMGWPEHGPFDRILVTAAAPSVPETLVNQLADDGVLVMPVGGPIEQLIVRVERRGSVVNRTPLLGCRFVKLVGREGWDVASEEET